MIALTKLHIDRKGTAMNTDHLVKLLAHSKAVWMVPELQNLVAVASSPSAAYKLVLKRTGKQKKARAAHKFAQAVRDYDPMLVRSALRWLKYVGNNRPELLKQHFSTQLRSSE